MTQPGLSEMRNVQVRVTNDLEIPLAQLSKEEIRHLLSSFDFPNPDFNKLIAMGKSVYGVPRSYPMAYTDNLAIHLPRGATGFLRKFASDCKFTLKFSDERSSGEPVSGFPKHNRNLYPYQVTAVESAIQKQNCLIRAPTGCLTGDTIVTINRAGKSSKMRLEHVVHMFNGGKRSGKVWNPGIETYIRAPFKDGSVRLAKVQAAFISGVKEVYRISFEDGSFVIGTPDHKFMTPQGWQPLINLTLGSEVYKDGGIPKRQEKSKIWYKLKVVPKHPYVGRIGVNPSKGGFTVPLHRLIMEAKINGLSLESFINQIAQDAQGLIFLDPAKYVVHHIDGNSLNNDISNLQLLTHTQHKEAHRNEAISNVTSKLTTTKVSSVAYVGTVQTYDLTVEDASAFIANGIAVHNSGKTTAAIALAQRLGLKTLVIVWSNNLLKQWVTRISDELGIPKKDIGIISSGTRKVRDITVAMQQTLISEKTISAIPDLHTKFGLVICDEVQRFAAKTFIQCIAPFNSKYRIGVSADETRKDQKEFLIYSLFGSVAADISKDDLIQTGHILDVQIRVIPTEHENREYQATRNYDTLLKGLSDDETRNSQIYDLIQYETARGNQVFTLSHRREHCTKIADRIEHLGVRSGLLLGGPDNALAFEASREGLNSGRLMAGVGTIPAIGQGLDIPSVSVAIVVSPIATNRQQFGQVRGRVCRTAKGKSSATLYYLWDYKVFGNKHVRNLMDWNKDVVIWDRDRWVRTIPDRFKRKTLSETTFEELLNPG